MVAARGRGHTDSDVVPVVQVADLVVLADVDDNVVDDEELLHDSDGIGCGGCDNSKPGLDIPCSEVPTRPVAALDVGAFSAVVGDVGNAVDGDDEGGVPIVPEVHVVDLVVLADVGVNVADDEELLHGIDGIGCGGCGNGKPGLGIPCSEVPTRPVAALDVGAFNAVDGDVGNAVDGNDEEGVPIVLVVHVLADVGDNVADDEELLHDSDGIGCGGCGNGKPGLGIPRREASNGPFAALDAGTVNAVDGDDVEACTVRAVCVVDLVVLVDVGDKTADDIGSVYGNEGIEDCGNSGIGESALGLPRKKVVGGPAKGEELIASPLVFLVPGVCPIPLSGTAAAAVPIIWAPSGVPPMFVEDCARMGVVVPVVVVLAVVCLSSRLWECCRS